MFLLPQSRYFECDDDDDESDTYSNLSALIDCDEFSAHVDNDEAFYCNGDDENCSYRGFAVDECDGTYLNKVDVVAKE